MPGSFEVNSVVVQEENGRFQRWCFRTLAELGLKEIHLEEAVKSNPMSLIVEPLGMYAGEIATFSQPVLRSTNQARKPDIIIVTDHADLVVVELKRSVNAELQEGRWAISQVVEYAALLSSTPEADLVRALSIEEELTSWEQLCQNHFGPTHQSKQTAEKIRQCVRDGHIHLVIACDSSPADLADIVQAASNLSALGFELHVIEVRPMVPVESFNTGSHPIIWIPTPQLDTEIVHRTSVTIRAEGFDSDTAPSINVNVESDSAETIESKKSQAKMKSRRNYETEMQSVIEPLAKSLDLEAEELWNELHLIHQAALTENWNDLRDAIGSHEDSGPYVRKRYGEGRYGVNLLWKWEPSVFVGAYLLDIDHKAPLLELNSGGDFALILDVGGHSSKRLAFSSHKLFRQLQARLRENEGPWRFPSDQYNQPQRNSWHPLLLRCPLRDVLEEAHSFEERRTNWLRAAQDAVTLLLEGGELARMCREKSREQSD